MEWLYNGRFLRVYSSGSDGSLWIPDDCALEIKWIRRHVPVDSTTLTQLLYSHRNEGYPWLQGMYSMNIVNINRYNYYSKAQFLPELRMQSFIDGIATFEEHVSSQPHVIPENHAFYLRLPGPFASDTLRLIVRPSNCPAAESFDQEGLTVTELQQDELEFEVKLRVNPVPSIRTPRGCELFLQRISREVSFEMDRIDPRLRKQIKFGFLRGDGVNITIGSRINFVASHHYVETLADLPRLQFSSYSWVFERVRFKNKDLDMYIVPSDTLFHLHLVKKEGRSRFKRDEITFLIHRKPNCEIIPSIENTQGLKIRQSSRQGLFKIIINRDQLNRNNEIGTQVTIRSNCDLEFQRIIRTLTIPVSYLLPDEKVKTAFIEMDSPYINNH